MRHFPLMASRWRAAILSAFVLASGEVVTVLRASSPANTAEDQVVVDAGVRLRDQFDDGSIGTNTGGIGSGFVLNDIFSSPAAPASSSAVESGGLATLAGSATVKGIVSKDALDPIGLTMTWAVATRSSLAGNGVIVGWSGPNGFGCCAPGIFLEVSGGRVVLDINHSATPSSNPQISRYLDIALGSVAADRLYLNGGSPIVASVYVDNAGWRVDVTGNGVEIHQAGTYATCQIFSSHGLPCGTPANVLGHSGGTLRAFGAAMREGVSAAFDRVDIVDARCDDADHDGVCDADDPDDDNDGVDDVNEDRTPPVVTVPAPLTVEATSAAGAIATFTVTAFDNVNLSVAAVCAPASGSVFALGNTTVSCSASDAEHNVGTASFVVTVRDTTGPVITTPESLLLEATGPSGAAATFVASAVDAVSGVRSVACTPAIGTVLPLGNHTITCFSIDPRKNSSTSTVYVTVRDRTGPVVTVPASPLYFEATSGYGAAATFSFSASDVVSATRPEGCKPASGSTFALGSHTVTCYATDAAGNVGSASFTLTVADTTPPVLAASDFGEVIPWAYTRVWLKVGDAVGVQAVEVELSSPDNPSFVQRFAASQLGSWWTPWVWAYADKRINVYVLATDTSGNQAGYYRYLDNDGLAATVDSPLFVRDDHFNRYVAVANGAWNQTFGQLERRGGAVKVVDRGSEPGVEVTTYSGTATGIASIYPCGNANVQIDLAYADAGHVALTCSDPNSSGHRSVTASGSGVLWKRTLYSNSWSGTQVYWDKLYLATTSWLTAGSPRIADPDNTEAIRGEIYRETADGGKVLIGSYLLDPGESIDTREGPDAPEYVVLGGAVTFTVNGSTTEMAEGETFTVPDAPHPPALLMPDRHGAAHKWSFDEGRIRHGIDTGIATPVHAIRGASVASAERLVCGVPTAALAFFAGADMEVGLGHAAREFSNGDFTMSVWFNGGPQGGTVPILSTIPGEGVGRFALVVRDGRLAFDLSSPNVSPVTLNGPIVTDRVWHLATITRAGAELSLWLDGAQVATGVLSGELDLAVTATVRLGGTMFTTPTGEGAPAESGIDAPITTAPQFDGLIDDVRFYTRALGAAEIAEGDACGLPDIVAEAVGSGGAPVVFAVGARDENADGEVIDSATAPTCDRESGSSFTLGDTVVTCSAIDGDAYSSTGRFIVRVVDTTAPSMGSIADIDAQATSSAGVPVSFAVPVANDLVSGSIAVTCVPAAGSMFSIGVTTVTCTAADQASNTASTSFAVTVHADTTAPVVTVPLAFAIPASSAAGATVTFAAAAHDAVNGPRPVTCVPASGATFPIGATTVRCVASDASGNEGAASFAVTVTDVTTPGNMKADAAIVAGSDRYAFTFHVRESARRDEQGAFRLTIERDYRRSSGRQGRSKAKDDVFQSDEITFIAFSDDPTIRPGRSRRPMVDSVVFSGVGKWNGRAGYTFEVTASDEGEPGRHRESASIVIRSASGDVVAEISGELTTGNVQSSRIKH